MFNQEVTIVGMEKVNLEDSTLLKVSVIEDAENTPNKAGSDIGIEWCSKPELFSLFANELPMEATIEFGIQRNSKQRSEMKILSIQKGWKSKIESKNAVDRIKQNGN